MVVGCQPYAPAAFTPRKYSCYSFLLEAESTPGPQCDRKYFMSMKNPLTPAGIEPATFRFVAQHLCYRGPRSKHLEAWNNLSAKQKFCVSSWLITEMHGQQNLKTFTLVCTWSEFFWNNKLCNLKILFSKAGKDSCYIFWSPVPRNSSCILLMSLLI